jgi:hypothetical protein
LGSYFTLNYPFFIDFLIGIVSGILAIIIIYFEGEKALKNLYNRLIERMNKHIIDDVRKDMESYSRIEDKDIRNIMIKSYVNNVFEKDSFSHIWTEVIMIINLLVISFNLIIILITSFISNANSVFTLLFQERIKEIGVAKVSQELGINYSQLPQTFNQNMGLYMNLIQALPTLLLASFLVIFYGFSFYLISKSAKNARNKAINKIIIEIYSKK